MIISSFSTAIFAVAIPAATVVDPTYLPPALHPNFPTYPTPVHATLKHS